MRVGWAPAGLFAVATWMGLIGVGTSVCGPHWDALCMGPIGAKEELDATVYAVTMRRTHMHSTHGSTLQRSAQPPPTRAKPTRKAMCAPAHAGKPEMLKAHACPPTSQAAAAVPGAVDTPPPAPFFMHMGRALAEMYAGEFRIP